jgi:hypothetical protein
MDGMWKSLPDDCVKNIMSFWSPKHAHELKVVLRLNEIVSELVEFMRHFNWTTMYKEPYKHIEYKQFKRYVNLWNLIVKKYSDSGRELYFGQGRTGREIITIEKVKLTKSRLTISSSNAIHYHFDDREPRYDGLKNRQYFVDNEDKDYREVAKNYVKRHDLDFHQDAWWRNDISKKMLKQERTHDDFIRKVVNPLKNTIMEYIYDGDKRKWLYGYL